MAINPEQEPVWDASAERFRYELVDPENGVKTTWEENSRRSLGKRIDELPNGGPTRTILWVDGLYTQYTAVDNRIGPITEFEYLDGRLRKELKITFYPVERIRLGLISTLRYSTIDGSFQSFVFESRSEGEEDSDFLGSRSPFEREESFKKRSVEENCQNIASIYKFRGINAFLSEYVSKPQSGDESLRMHAASVQYDIDEKEWSPERMELASASAREFILSVLGEYLGADFSLDEKNVLTSLFTLYLVARLPADFSDYSLDSDLKRALPEVASELLANYYGNLQSAGDFEVEIKPTADSEELEFSVEQSDKQIYTSKVRLSQEHHFDEFSYLTEKIDPDIIRLNIKSLIKPGSGGRFLFHRKIDTQRLINLLIQTERIGWEEAFRLADTSFILT